MTNTKTNITRELYSAFIDGVITQDRLPELTERMYEVFQESEKEYREIMSALFAEISRLEKKVEKCYTKDSKLKIKKE